MGQTRGEEETLRETTRLPRKYELMTIISPDVAEDELSAMIDRVGGYITTAGGTISETLRESPWGRRRLAYAVRHAGRDVRDGFYTVYHFEAQPGAITDIERELRITDQVMRFLVTHYVPQPVTQRPAEATEAETGEQTAVVEPAAEVEAPVEEAAPIEVEAESSSVEVPAEDEAFVEVEAEAPAVEAPQVETEPEEPVAEATAPDEEPAAPKKRATRRKKAAEPEETVDEPASE
jgi:small subunit ribosomal protein S6